MGYALIEEERNFYIRNGISSKTIEDMRRQYYLANISVPDESLAAEDLEVIWLQEQSGIVKSDNADDLWYLWLSPLYGNKSVLDLKWEYYQK